ncbi:MAG: alpha/beta hydrolase [Bacteroidetes bacterium]|nr:alpha/beta hydrolase [Bacteroidota bacterium]
MSIFILSNRGIVRYKGENKDSFSNDEYSLPNFRIARCNFENYIPPKEDDKKNKKKYKNRNILDYQLLSEPGEYGYAKVLDLLLKEKGLKDSPITADHLGGSQRMFYELYKSMVKSDKKNKDVLIFIHGYAYTFDDELKAILDLKKIFVDNKNTPIENMIFVSWPASSSVFPLTYFDDKLMSINSGHSLMRLFYLYTQFLKEIFSNKDLRPCNQKIHIIAHSMGNRVLQSMLYSLKTENITRVIDQVILLNSDVSHRVFEEAEDSFCKLPLLANRISIYINRKDLILNISQFSKNILSPRLGKSGPSNFDKLKNVVSVIDCTQTKNDLNSSLKMELGEHWGYLSSSSVQNDLFENLKGIEKNLIANRQKIDDSTFELMS